MTPEQYTNAAQGMQIRLDELETELSEYFRTDLRAPLNDIAQTKTDAEQLAAGAASEPEYATGKYGGAITDLNNVSIRATQILQTHGFYAPEGTSPYAQQLSYDYGGTPIIGPALNSALGYNQTQPPPDPGNKAQPLGNALTGLGTVVLLVIGAFLIGRN